MNQQNGVHRRIEIREEQSARPGSSVFIPCEKLVGNSFNGQKFAVSPVARVSTSRCVRFDFSVQQRDIQSADGHQQHPRRGQLDDADQLQSAR